jgi:hypothetical protein
MIRGEPIPTQPFWLGLSVCHGFLLTGWSCLSLGLRTLTGCVAFIGINPLFDSDCDHHGANHNNCSSDNGRRREQADPDAPQRRGGCGRRGDCASSRDIAKHNSVVIERVKAPLRQDRPFVGGFSHHAMPVVRPGVLSCPLKGGESRARILPRSRTWIRRCASRESAQERDACSVKHGDVLTREGLSATLDSGSARSTPESGSAPPGAPESAVLLCRFVLARSLQHCPYPSSMLTERPGGKRSKRCRTEISQAVC